MVRKERKEREVEVEKVGEGMREDIGWGRSIRLLRWEAKSVC